MGWALCVTPTYRKGFPGKDRREQVCGGGGGGTGNSSGDGDMTAQS